MDLHVKQIRFCESTDELCDDLIYNDAVVIIPYDSTLD